MTRVEIGSFAKLNAAVKVIDGFTGKPIASGIEFEIDGVKCTPLGKGDGIFVFTEDIDQFLPHVVKMTCKGFFDVEAPILSISSSPLSLGPLAEAVQVFALQPALDYAYPENMTLVCGRVMSDEGSGVENVVVAYVLDGRRGASFSGAGGYYRLPLPAMRASSAEIEVIFLKSGFPKIEKNVLVKKGQSYLIGDVVVR